MKELSLRNTDGNGTLVAGFHLNRFGVTLEKL